jgi:hypothetical protein
MKISALKTIHLQQTTNDLLLAKAYPITRVSLLPSHLLAAPLTIHEFDLFIGLASFALILIARFLVLYVKC